MNNYLSKLLDKGFVTIDTEDADIELLKRDKASFFKKIDAILKDILSELGKDAHFIMSLPFEVINIFSTKEIMKLNYSPGEDVMCIPEDSEELGCLLLSDEATDVKVYIVYPEVDENIEE